MDIGTLLVALLPLAFVIYWVTDLIKEASNADVRSVVTKVVAVAGAFIVISLVAHSDLNLAKGEDAARLSATLKSLSWQATLLMSIIIAAGGGAFADFLRSRNAADPSVKSRLLEKVSFNSPPDNGD